MLKFFIFKTDFMEIRKTFNFYMVIVMALIVIIAGTGLIYLILHGNDWLKNADAIPILQELVSILTYFIPFTLMLTFMWSFSGMRISIEKMNGNLEALLVTPVSVKDIWLGKSLAIFSPGFILSLITTLIVILSINFLVILPGTGQLVLPLPALLTGFILNPLLFLSLQFFIILISMISNPDLALVPTFIIGFGIMIGIPLGLAVKAFSLASWNFTIWYLFISVFAFIIICFLSRFLTNERVLLSSRK